MSRTQLQITSMAGCGGSSLLPWWNTQLGIKWRRVLALPVQWDQAHVVTIGPAGVHTVCPPVFSLSFSLGHLNPGDQS